MAWGQTKWLVLEKERKGVRSRASSQLDRRMSHTEIGRRGTDGTGCRDRIILASP